MIRTIPTNCATPETLSRNIGKRIAAEGYSVLVPNPFYRVAKAPQFDSAATFDFQNQAEMAKLKPLMGSVNAPGAAEKDAIAYIALLDAQSQVKASRWYRSVE
jgi:carboxymethylenebutenolidase